MPNNLEDRFRAELKRRQQYQNMPVEREDRRQVTGWILVVLVLSLGWSVHQCRSDSFTKKLTYQSDQSNKVISQLKPVALPQTDVMKKANIRTNNSGQLRVFLRSPLSSEKSSLPATCSGSKSVAGITRENHYFIELVDWESDTVITSAFIRAG